MKLFLNVIVTVVLSCIILSCEKKPYTLFDNGYYSEKTQHFYFINGDLGIGTLDHTNKFVGAWEFYNSKGFLVEKCNYKHGLKNGSCEFYQSGQLIESGYFEKGMKIDN